MTDERPVGQQGGHPGHEQATGPTRLAMRCTVAGRVQGVFFRASAREEALRLGLTGYARNLPDGRVEVFACGDADGVGAMREWLRRGPPQADVSGVACEPVEPRDFSGFTTA